MHKVSAFSSVAMALFCSLCCYAAGTSEASSAPAWVTDPKQAYPDAKYLSAVGYGPSRAQAEKNSLSAMVSVFGQSVSVKSDAVQHYSQAVKDGTIKVDKDFAVADQVNTTANYSLIVGAEVRENWFDGKSTYYALAVMDKLKSSLVYSQLIEKNQATVVDLTTLSDDEKYTFEAYRRIGLAIDVAEVNGQFVNILSVLSPAQAAAEDVTSSDSLRTQRLKVAQGIAIAVSVTGDRDDRVKAAIASAVQANEFRVVDASAPYSLRVKLDMPEMTLAGNSNKFVRYVLDIQLIDERKGTSILSFSRSGRSGQLTVAEAQERALRTVVSLIKDEFGQQFQDYLAGTAGSKQ